VKIKSKILNDESKQSTMKEKFENRRLSGALRIKLERDDHSCGKYWEGDKAEMVRQMVEITNDYKSQGYRLTLRQLYYQMVSRNYIPNDQNCYGKLSSVLDDCRYSGVIDWDIIEDRGRVPFTPYYENSVADALEKTVRWYALDKKIGQPVYTELWTEKDAISSILKQSVEDYTITVGINKGFASSTAMYEAYTRFMKEIKNRRKVVVLYFGDHDPSGLDMIRDIQARLEGFMAKGRHQSFFVNDLDTDDLENILYDNRELADRIDKCISAKRVDETLKRTLFAQISVKKWFEVKHIGLTMEQIEEFDLPPNPAKFSDPRAKKYVQEHGDVSWEVDALSPTAILDIVRTSLDEVIDYDALEKIKQRESDEIEYIRSLIKNME